MARITRQEMTDVEGVVVHALGYSSYRRTVGYRNHYACNKGEPTQAVSEAITAGWMRHIGDLANCSYFAVTKAGIEHAMTITGCSCEHETFAAAEALSVWEKRND